MSIELPEVPPSEAHRRAAAGEVVLLDVREDDEWQAGRAEGAVHLPMSRFDLSAVPQDRPVVAVCRVGGRSAAVTDALRQRGVDVVNLRGGMLAWAAAGLPVVRDAGAPGEVL